MQIKSSADLKGPLVSIIMSVYKEPFMWLDEAIESVLNQTYPFFEFLIVDDNPENFDLRYHLKSWSSVDSRIKLIFNDVNIGLTKSLNRACSQMEGSFMARIDADDCWKPEKLKRQLDFFDSNPSVAVCGTWVYLIDENSTVTGQYQYPIGNISIGKQMLFTNPIIHSSVMLRTSLILARKDCVYDAIYTTSQDYALWTSLYLDNIHFANLPLELVLYRKSEGQITKRKKEEQCNNAQMIAKRFRDAVFNRVGIIKYDELSCDELSKLLASVECGDSLKQLCYYYLMRRYRFDYRNNINLLAQLIRTADIFRFPLKDTLKLVCRRQ